MNYIEPLSIIGIFFLSFYLIRKYTTYSIYLLLILSILLHKELFSFYQWDLMPIRAYMFAFFGSFCIDVLLKLLAERNPRKLLQSYFVNPALVFLSLYWLVAGISIIFSLNLKASILLFGFLTTVVVFFIVFISKYSQNPEQVSKFIKFYIFLGFLLTLFGYFQSYLYYSTGKIIGALWNIPGNLARVGASFWDVNHFAAFLAALIPVSGVLFLTEKGWSKKLYYFIVSLSLTVSLLITNSRTAWIMAFVSFIVFIAVLLIHKFGAKGIVILLSPLIIGAAGILYGYSQKDSPFRAYIKQYLHYRLDSFDSHMLLLYGAFEIFETYPILGGGYGGFFEHFSKTEVGPVFYGRDPAAITSRVPAHTIWGELLSGVGSVGFSMYLLFTLIILGTLYYALAKAPSKQIYLICVAMFSTLLGWLIAGIFYSYNSEFFWILWALYFAYALGVSNLTNSFSPVLNYFYTNRSFSKSVIIFLSILLIFWSLGTNHLIPWDEAIYAKISKNMVTSGDFVTQHWKNSSIWYEKPPLYMWLEATLMLVMGFSHWAVRLPSALFGLLTVILIYKLGERKFNRTVGFISAFCLVTTTHFLYYSRTGMLDVTTTFFITLAVYNYVLAKQEQRISRFVWSGLALGFAVMTKGVVGFMGIGIITLSEIFSKQRISLKNYFQIILSMLAISLPWHVVMFKLYGWDFINNYIGYHVIDRAANAIEDKGNPVWWYVIVLKVSMRIWFIPLILAVPYALFKLIKGDKRLIPFFVWVLLIFGMFSAAQSKLVWYIMPIYPALAIINGYFIDEFLTYVLKRFNSHWFISLKVFALFSLFVFTLTYLALNKEKVYTSDLTGSQARLMLRKEQQFGKDTKVFLDRIELPLALYYLNGPFEIVDFSPNNIKRVPKVDDNQKLILITKKGRFSNVVAGYTEAPLYIEEDGDWVLWAMPQKAR